MRSDYLDGRDLRRLVLAAAAYLDQNKAAVDALNVFPVPDGDTGTNMAMTLKAAAREIQSADTPSVDEMAKAVAHGCLMGARGNSGVILSQIFRGFSKSLEEKRQMGPLDFAWALQTGVDLAYKAVMKPAEGTILTVAREAGRAALSAGRSGADVPRVVEAALRQAEATLARTPEMLPVLRQAGVVDAGGKGLVYILTAWSMALRGEEIADTPILTAPQQQARSDTVAAKSDVAITFPYDTVFMVRGRGIPVNLLRQQLEPMGDSLVVVGDEGLVKVHIHVTDPGPVLTHCLRFGELIEIEIENMRLQHEALSIDAGAPAAEHEPATAATPQPAEVPVEEKDLGVVAIGVGEGIAEVLRSLGVDVVVNGGQTMNPSTEDILQAVDRTGARRVLILPNNKNIILTAEQTRNLTEREIGVVPTRSVPQGIAALLALNPEQSIEQNVTAMTNAAKRVKTGEITYAVRTTTYRDREIHEGDIMGIFNGEIRAVGTDPQAVLRELVSEMVESEDSMITVFYGQDIAPEVAEQAAEELAAAHPDCELDLHSGGQPLYYYLISVE
ncbi:MAG: DAK2 domain-containing protein [Chloroflexota bacterium]